MRTLHSILDPRLFVGASLACLLFAGSTNANEGTDPGPTVEWAENFESAMQRGRDEGKPVLIVFSGRAQEMGVEDDY